MKLYSATKSFFPLALLSLFLFFSGCAPYKGEERNQHWLYHVVPRHRCQIRWYDMGHWLTWMLFGNDDDGIFGEGACYHPSQPENFKKAVGWYLRNPLHNFFFYTIGTAYCKNSELTLFRLGDGQVRALEYCPVAHRNFGGRTTSLFLALHGWKPFISLRLTYSRCHEGQFYLGWRERGNFGIKLAPFKTRKI